MTILVFGKTGQVARELQAQAPVVALGRDRADFTDPETCFAAIEAYSPTAVINAAAYTAVDKAEEEEGLATQINGATPAAIASACAMRGIPFVTISTDYVFDGSGGKAWEPGEPPSPVNAYGRSKLAGEKGVLRAGGQSVVLRTSWIFSEHGQNFVKTMLRLSRLRPELSVVADQIGGPTPAADIASACLSIASQLTQDPTKTGIYHLSGAPDVSWAEFSRAVFAASGRDIKVSDIKSLDYLAPAVRPLNSRLDCQTTLAAFGIARPDWREAVLAVVDKLENGA